MKNAWPDLLGLLLGAAMIAFAVAVYLWRAP